MIESNPKNVENIYVLDGGFSSQLSRHVGVSPDGHPLWTSRFLQTHSQEIVDTHLDFIRAGSDIISTNTYQASVGAFMKHLGISSVEGLSLIKHAVRLAQQARSKYIDECKSNDLTPRNILVAGSVGPYGASLNDGSEYSGNYIKTISEEHIHNWHKPRLDVLVESGVDLIAFETIPCEKEALVLVNMLKEYPEIKGWISFCCKDNLSIAHGEFFSKVVMNCLQANSEQILAVGINCCSPKLVRDLITSVEIDIPIVTYPNSGEKFIPGLGWADDQCQPLHSFVSSWLDINVKFIGGCCRTYCEDIAKIRSEVDIWIKDKQEKLTLPIINKVFGVSVNKKKYDDKIKQLLTDNEALRSENLNLSFEISKLKKDNGKLKDENFSDYLSLMRERDARYTLYFENLSLHLRLKELDDGSSQPMAIRSDPTILRIALDRCREQLSSTQSELKRMKEEYAETVPRRDFEHLEGENEELQTKVQHQIAQLEHLQSINKKVTAHKNSIEEELMECRERCRELERAGTPRPPWDLCADFIGGGKKRWCQLTEGLPSRDKLRALLKELGPAAESEHLEYFDGLGTDPAVPPYLRYSGRVRNLRLSRREVRVVVNDVWRGRPHHPHLALQDFVTKYFEDRYQQSSVRAEWAYNVCAGAESMLDEPQVRVWWGALHGQLSEQVYWGLRRQWDQLQQHLRRHALDGETVTMEEFERVSRSIFPLKSEVDIKNLTDVVKKQLKIKLNCNEINLDKLFYENEEGFDRVELARELFRQRQLGQDKYIREVVTELGGRRAQRNVTVDALKRAFAIVDPAIDHVRMEQYIRWAFSDQTSEISVISPLPLQNIALRLAAGDIERVGPRSKGVRRNFNKQHELSK